MSTHLFYYTCPNPKCGCASHVALKGEGPVVHHYTTHTLSPEMFEHVVDPSFFTVCMHCGAKITFYPGVITVAKPKVYDPMDYLNTTTKHFLNHCDLAGGEQHIKIIVGQPDYVLIIDRELKRLDSTHLAAESKRKIAGKWLRSFIISWVKGSKGNGPNLSAMDAEYTLLMSSMLDK